MKYCVIKIGGSVMDELPQSFFEDIVFLRKSSDWAPVIVHGGGPLISSMLTKLNIQSEFVNGLRVTTEDVLNIVEMVLSGTVNKRVVRKFIQANGTAYGISGVDGMLLEARCSSDYLGFVGEVTKVRKGMIEEIIAQGHIPVISPVGIDNNGQRYNINGDVAASAVASSLEASLCMISDIPGVYKEINGEKIIFHELSKAEVEEMIVDGSITGGMIPKVTAAIDGLVHNVPEVIILNGKEEHSLLDYVAGKTVGTRILMRKEQEHANER